MKSFLPLLLLSLVAPKPGFAAEACPESGAFRRQIYNCGQNQVAVAEGTACARLLITRAHKRGQELSKLFTSLKSKLGSAQKLSMADTTARLNTAISSLEKQIAELQGYTDRVASYSEQMIDFSNSENDSSSPDCFNDNFHALQKVVDRLDNEIIKSKEARETALQMLATSTGREVKLDDDKTSANGAGSFRATGGKNGVAPPVIKGEDRRGQSDISGTEKIKKKK